MVKVAVLVRPQLASTGSSGCIWRLGVALRTREDAPSVSDPSERPCLSSQRPPKSPLSLRLAIQVHRSRAYLASPSLAATLNLLLLRWLARDYEAAFALCGCCASDTRLSDEEAQVMLPPLDPLGAFWCLWWRSFLGDVTPPPRHPSSSQWCPPPSLSCAALVAPRRLRGRRGAGRARVPPAALAGDALLRRAELPVARPLWSEWRVTATSGPTRRPWPSSQRPPKLTVSPRV